MSHPLILLRAQASPSTCIPGVSPVYAMGHTMRLDKIMIGISIHLHSLPRGTTLSFTSAIRAISSFTISHFAERLSLSYECSARTDGARFVEVEMRHCGPTRTKAARCGATKGRKDRLTTTPEKMYPVLLSFSRILSLNARKREFEQIVLRVLYLPIKSNTFR